MRMHETNGSMENMVRYIQFEINKHGHWGPAETVEEAVNAMSNYELLQMIAGQMDTTDERPASSTSAQSTAEILSDVMHEEYWSEFPTTIRRAILNKLLFGIAPTMAAGGHVRVLTIAEHVAEFNELFKKYYGGYPDLSGHTDGSMQSLSICRGYLLGKGYSLAETCDIGSLI